MTRHLGLFSHALIGGLLLLTSAVATQAQTTAPALGGALPDAIKTGPASPGNIAQINDFIKARVEAIAGGDVQAAQTAREQLIDAVTPAGKVTPGPAFLNQFAVSLDAAIAPALKHQSYTVRMNAGIAVARAAQLTDDAALVNATQTLLGDQSAFVALWGLKAARSVLPAVLRNPAANPNNLLAAVLKAATTHGSGGIGSAIIAEAYDVLSLDYFGSPKVKPTPDALKKVIPTMQQLLGERVAAYKNGIPPEPLAESRATLFLTDTRVWREHTPQQKLADMQLMSDLVGLAAQQTAAVPAAEKDGLVKMISLVVAAIAVVPETAPISAQLQGIKLNANLPPQQIVQLVAPIAPGLKGIKGFETLTPPPTASTGGPVAAGTQPSAAASTTPATPTPASAP